MSIPLSLYIHVPWCVRKCPYCDFNSHQVTGDLPEEDYVRALADDLAAQVAAFGEHREVETVFIGGGTPSLLSGQAIGRLMDEVQRITTLASQVEITLEANPGTLADSHQRFLEYRAAGINRLSLGAQSFSDASLRAIGRIHDSGQIHAAYDGARRAGFERINIDLMHGLPGQTITNARRDVLAAVALSPEHVSWYQLTIEPNTVFFSNTPDLPDEDTLSQIYDEGRHVLQEAGFERYEVSAFCLPGEEARHNLNYWQFGDYLGIGAGAHGKLTRPDGIVRTTKTRLPKDYLMSPTSTRVLPVIDTALPLEFLMNALRLPNGFSVALFEARTGLDATILAGFVDRAVSRGLLASEAGQLRPTPLGLDWLNDLLLMADDTMVARG